MVILLRLLLPVLTVLWVGSVLAGTDEAPGEVILYQGRSYKYIEGWEVLER